MSEIGIKEFGKDFHSEGGALTLSESAIGTHENGWTVTGEVHEDYYTWVNDFEATHPTLGRVWGNFEKKVFYTSLEAYNNFVKCFPPNAWDYWDI